MRLRAAALAIALGASAAAASQEPAIRTVAVGEALVPPGDYRHGVTEFDPARYDPDESGPIYDVAYGGIVGGKLMFRHRGYSIRDLAAPAFEQEFTFPRDQAEIELRDVIVHVVKADPARLTYRVTFLPPAEMTDDPCETHICTSAEPGEPAEAQP